MKLALRELYLLLGFILLLCGFSYYQYLWIPQQQQTSALVSDNQALQDHISQISRARRQQKRIIDAQPQVEKDIAALRQLLPAEPGIPDLIKYAEAQALAGGCTLQRVTNGGILPGGLVPDELSLSAAAAGVKPVQIEFEVMGDYYALRRFILAMENSPRMLSCDKLQISVIEAGEIPVNEMFDGHNLRLNLTVTIYYDEEGI